MIPASSPGSAPGFATRLRTPRLRLRTFKVSDAERVVAIQSNWKVVRMLRAARRPVELGATREWLADHRREWEGGLASRFAIEAEGLVIGCADVDEIADGHGELGYWLDETAWGRGFATEAAGEVVRFAFEAVGLGVLLSGHASDNERSGVVLRKLGFTPAGKATLWSIPRSRNIDQKSYRLTRS